MKFVKIAALLLIAVLALTFFASCGDTTTAGEDPATESKTEETATEESGLVVEGEGKAIEVEW